AEEQRAASEHLGVLVDTCPLGILVANGNGELVLANERARSLFGLGEDFRTESLGHYIPPLRNVLKDGGAKAGQRTELECRARRRAKTDRSERQPLRGSQSRQPGGIEQSDGVARKARLGTIDSGRTRTAPPAGSADRHGARSHVDRGPVEWHRCRVGVGRSPA